MWSLCRSILSNQAATSHECWRGRRATGGEEEPGTFCQRRERRELRFCTEGDCYHRSRWLTAYRLSSSARHAAVCRVPTPLCCFANNFLPIRSGERSDLRLIVGRELRCDKSILSIEICKEWSSSSSSSYCGCVAWPSLCSRGRSDNVADSVVMVA